jgi:hypothetical protein
MANIDTNTLLYFGEATKKNMKLAESYKSYVITILCFLLIAYLLCLVNMFFGIPMGNNCVPPLTYSFVY